MVLRLKNFTALHNNTSNDFIKFAAEYLSQKVLLFMLKRKRRKIKIHYKNIKDK